LSSAFQISARAFFAPGCDHREGTPLPIIHIHRFQALLADILTDRGG